MFRQFEIILTGVCLGLSAVFLTRITFRIRDIFLKKHHRIPLWNKEVGLGFRLGKLVLAVSLILMVPGIIFFLFIAAPPSAVIRNYAKAAFCILFIAWGLVEASLCFSISEKLLNASKVRRAFFFLTVMICLAAAVYLFPLIPRSLTYPAESDCVLLELPVRGTWLAGHGGATDITNGHSKYPFAVDFLKLGPDGRLYKGREEAVTDFYSDNEGVYAPADGRVTQVVNQFESDLLGQMDEDHPGGNFINIDIGGGKFVHLAHLKQGSITVEAGQFVKAGDLLGKVGNSGYSTHPHLHMHIQNQPSSDAEGWLTYPFRFLKMERNRLFFWRAVSNGYLMRNDIFRDES